MYDVFIAGERNVCECWFDHFLRFPFFFSVSLICQSVQADEVLSGSCASHCHYQITHTT